MRWRNSGVDKAFKEPDHLYWKEVRQRGRSRFILFHCVLPMSLVGFFLGGLRMHVMGYSFSDVLSLSGAAVLYFAVAVAVLVGYAGGMWEWKRSEMEFNRRSPSRD